MKPRHLRGNDGQGMNWLRPEKRLAIYLRDGLACAWCGRGVEEEGMKLTLDHLTPRSKGGSNDATNLVTACCTCNSSRGNRSIAVFAKAVAIYVNHGVTAKAVLATVTAAAKRAIDVTGAKELMARRGGFSNAVNGGRS